MSNEHIIAMCRDKCIHLVTRKHKYLPREDCSVSANKHNLQMVAPGLHNSQNYALIEMC